MDFFQAILYLLVFLVFSRSSRNFGKYSRIQEMIESIPRGNQGVKKGPGPRGTRDKEFLVPSLIGSVVYE